MMLLFTALCAGPASGAEPLPPRDPGGLDLQELVPAPAEAPSTRLEIGLRLRPLAVPRPLLDLRFADSGDPGWGWSEARPPIRGTALGVELVMRGPAANGLLYVEVVDLDLADGYWLPVASATDPSAGAYLAPRRGVGIVVLGADIAHEIHLVDTAPTGAGVGLSVLAGGGLGLGVLAGRIDRWTGDDSGNPAYQGWLEGRPPDPGAAGPRLIPVLDGVVAVRLSVGGHLAWRLEGGFHSALFYGTSVGIIL